MNALDQNGLGYCRPKGYERAVPNKVLRHVLMSELEGRRLNAQVTYWSEDRAFGFLDSQDGRVFFHASEYAKPEVPIRLGRPTLVSTWEEPQVKVGDWINYLPVRNTKGLAAQGWCHRKDWEGAVAALAAPPPYQLVTRYWTKKGPVADPKSRSWVTIYTLQERVVSAGYDVDYMGMPYLASETVGTYQNRLTFNGEVANDQMDRRFRTPQDWFDLPVGTVRHQVVG